MESRMRSEEWLEKVVEKEAKWIFNAKDFRAKVLAQACIIR